MSDALKSFDTDKNEITDQSGYVDIISVEINGQSVEAEMGYIETVLKIKYDEIFKRGETYSIKLVYDMPISEVCSSIEQKYNIKR